MSPSGMNVKWYMKCFIYRTADVKSSELWSSQLWTQIYAIAYIEAWKSQDFNGVWTRDLAIPVRRSCVRHFNNWDQSRVVKYDKEWMSEKMIISKQFKVSAYMAELSGLEWLQIKPNPFKSNLLQEKNLSEHSRGSTNSTRIWERVRELNLGHIVGSRELSP